MAEQTSDRPPVMVRVVNKTPQTLTVTVDSGSGVREIKLAGFGASDPVVESSLTAFTRKLAEQGRVRVRSA